PNPRPKFQYFQYIEDEIKINIFKHVEHPFNLAISCKSWSAISRDPHTKAEWLISRFGKAHALFYSIKLGPSFIDTLVCENLFTRGVIVSRYFIQRLLMQFGKNDQKLIELEIEHNVGVLPQKIKSPWASNLSLPAFLYLLNEGCNKLDTEVPLRGNDMELFHFLSAGPHVIDNAPGMMRKNLTDIEDLVLNQKFIPFPPKPKSVRLDLNHDPHILQLPPPEEYPPKDGYENRRHLIMIARAIFIHPYLVTLWKQIGYYEICNDVNDLVILGALTILFPSTPTPNWNCPTVTVVISRLTELINLGFELSNNVIIDALHMFKHRLDEIGNILWSVICEIRSDKPLAFGLFREVLKPERNLTSNYLLNFLKTKFDDHEQFMKQVVEQYFKEEKISDMESRRKSLILSPRVYQFILDTYGHQSELTLMCFEDILA
ncbi:12059_t:CDS:1, partial [Funneliformis mosseae]